MSIQRWQGAIGAVTNWLLTCRLRYVHRCLAVLRSTADDAVGAQIASRAAKKKRGLRKN